MTPLILVALVALAVISVVSTTAAVLCRARTHRHECSGYDVIYTTSGPEDYTSTATNTTAASVVITETPPAPIVATGPLSGPEPIPAPQEAQEAPESAPAAAEAPQRDIVADPMTEVPPLPFRSPKPKRQAPKPRARQTARTKTGPVPGLPRDWRQR